MVAVVAVDKMVEVVSVAVAAVAGVAVDVDVDVAVAVDMSANFRAIPLVPAVLPRRVMKSLLIV